MSHVPPMTRDELLELAPLDALGLLDEYDALLFSRGYHAAPERVRIEVRELQAAVAADESLLPDVVPSEGMRSRVIEAVRREADEAVDLAPLATIGRARPRTMATLDRPAAPAAGPIRPRRRLVDSLAGQAWRAAAFALAASLVVAVYFGTQVLDRNRELFSVIRQMQAEQAMAAELDRVSDGAGDAWLLQARKPATARVALVPTRDDLSASGMVYLAPHSGHGSLVLMGVPLDEADGLRLVIRDADGVVISSTAIAAGPALSTAEFTLDVDQLADRDGLRFEITGDGEPWLVSV